MSRRYGSSGVGSGMQPLTKDQRVAASSIIWVGVALVVGLFIFFNTLCFGRIKGDEVGVLLNRVTGGSQVVTTSGVKIYCGLTHKLYTLDKTLQTLEMTDITGKGDRAGKDDLKIKNVDGSDVYVDVKVQYEIIPDKADVVLETSGTGDAYKEKWARDMSRTCLRMNLGELKTEEVYDSGLRDEKVANSKRAINEYLEPFGIRVVSLVIPKKPHFYDDYEDMIKQKKLADQSVLEETSKAAAAQQKQETEIQTATNRMNVALKAFEGEIEQLVLAAEAKAETVMKAADAYHTQKTVMAKATLYQKEKEAKGIIAQRSAEAEGIAKLRAALEGAGGTRMVQLEYAKRLGQINFDAQPFMYEGQTSRVNLSGGVAQDVKMAATGVAANN